MNSFFKKNIFCECTKITVYAGTNVPRPEVNLKCQSWSSPAWDKLSLVVLIAVIVVPLVLTEWLAQELPLLAPPPSPASSSHLQVDPVSKWFLGIPTHILILIKKVLVPTGPSSQSLMAA